MELEAQSKTNQGKQKKKDGVGGSKRRSKPSFRSRSSARSSAPTAMELLLKDLDAKIGIHDLPVRPPAPVAVGARNDSIVTGPLGSFAGDDMASSTAAHVQWKELLHQSRKNIASLGPQHLKMSPLSSISSIPRVSPAEQGMSGRLMSERLMSERLMSARLAMTRSFARGSTAGSTAGGPTPVAEP